MALVAIRAGADFIEFDLGVRTVRVSETDVVLDTKDRMALALKQILQMQFEIRIKVRNLPSDDPDKNTDPAQPDIFWEGHGGNKDLVVRSLIVDEVTWDGKRYVPNITYL